jgi:ABC-type nitrate/sulfonate/bicarbonate transport system substrate-binding protein
MHRILIAASLCGALAQTAAAESVTLRYGQIPSTVRSVSSLYLFIAQHRGFFAREEIKIDLVPIPGGTDKMVAALDQGAVDVTQTATPYLIRAALAGSDAVAIAGETANPIYSLIAKPDIRSFADLKGRVLGLSLPVDTISISMRKLLALNGVREADYSVKELVGTPVRFDCLKRGECDAVPLGQPEDFLAVGQGFSRARALDRGGRVIPVPGGRGAAKLRAGEQGRGHAFRPGARRIVPLHPRGRKSRRGRQGDGRADRRLGGDRAADARTRARPGCGAEAGRDQS